MTNNLKLRALRILEALEAPALKTDSGVVAVFIYVTAYPGRACDVAAGTGLSEPAVAQYLAALSVELDVEDGVYRLSAKGVALFAASLAAPPVGLLTPDEAVAWEDVKRVIMDAPPDLLRWHPGPGSPLTLREEMAQWLAAYDCADAREADKLFLSWELPVYGIAMHRPGHPAILEVSRILEWRPELAPDEALLRKVARLGLSLW